MPLDAIPTRTNRELATVRAALGHMRHWLRRARPRARYSYHLGNLALDRVEDAVAHAKANAAWELARLGYVNLVQQRAQLTQDEEKMVNHDNVGLSPSPFHYYMIRTRRSL